MKKLILILALISSIASFSQNGNDHDDAPAAPINAMSFIIAGIGIAIGYGFCKLKNE